MGTDGVVRHRLLGHLLGERWRQAARDADRRQFTLLRGAIPFQPGTFVRQIGPLGVGLRRYPNLSAVGHRHRPGHPRRQDMAVCGPVPWPSARSGTHADAEQRRSHLTFDDSSDRHPRGCLRPGGGGHPAQGQQHGHANEHQPVLGEATQRAPSSPRPGLSRAHHGARAGTCWRSHASSCAAGTAPDRRASSAPPWNRIRVGMLRMA